MKKNITFDKSVYIKIIILMRKVHTINLLSLLLIFGSILLSCSDKDSETQEGNGITAQNWSNNETFFISAGQTLSFTFTAQSNWTAQNSATAFLTLDNKAGNSGKNTLKVTANSSSQEEGTITIKVNGYSSNSSFKIKLNKSGAKDSQINYSTDQFLKAYYLWNDEYKTLTPDFTLEYDEFLTSSLMSMKTNTLDKRLYYNGNNQPYYQLYSFIEKLDPTLQSTRSAKEPKVQEYNFGFINFVGVGYGKQGNAYLAVQGVYPGSSAAQAGIKRGTEITHVNGQIITKSNASEFYYSLMAPSTTSSLEVQDYNGKKYTISSAPIYPNPIIFSNVSTIGAHKIGYLVYSAFEAGFDEELFNEFKNFKNQRITDLILDLRYNGGGHVMSANLIASCIAGSSCVGQTFAAYRYNNDRMKELDNKKDIELFAYSNYKNLNNISLSEGGLNLPEVYCLVSNNTASASELVINSLRGIGIRVILIGATTNGKNVGMEGKEFTTAVAKYRLFPITFQTYNAKGFGEYQNGFTPDYIKDEDGSEEGYFVTYNDFGSKDEILYAEAIKHITGIEPVSTTRSANRVSGKIKTNMPEIRPIGMIK